MSYHSSSFGAFPVPEGGCPATTYPIEGWCIPEPACPPGWFFNKLTAKCTQTGSNQAVFCPTGTFLFGGACLTSLPHSAGTDCPAGSMLANGVCIPKFACPPGQKLNESTLFCEGTTQIPSGPSPQQVPPPLPPPQPVMASANSENLLPVVAAVAGAALVAFLVTR